MPRPTGMPESQHLDQILLGLDPVVRVIAHTSHGYAPKPAHAGVVHLLAGQGQRSGQPERLLEIFFERARCFGPIRQSPIRSLTNL